MTLQYGINQYDGLNNWKIWFATEQFRPIVVCLFQIPQEDAKRKSSLYNSEQKPVLKNDYKHLPNSASANGKPDVVNPNRINNKHNKGNVLCSVLRDSCCKDVFWACTPWFISFIAISSGLKI